MSTDTPQDAQTLRPKLRPVEAFPVEHDGRRMIGLRDPTGLAEGVVTLSPPAFFVVSRFDGKHSIVDIQADFARAFGELLMSEKIRELVAQLDAVHLLEGPRFEAYYRALAEQYRRSAVRRSSGHDDEAAAARLRAMLSEIVPARTPEGTPAGGSAPAGDPPIGPPGADHALCGLIAPHLDYARGKSCYRRAYETLASSCRAERFVILGTNHFGRAEGPVATGKDFATPLGLARTDREFLARLERCCGQSLCEHEFDHVREHSVELQVLLLQHVFGSERIRIVPILCPDPSAGADESDVRHKRQAMTALGEALRTLIRQDPVPTCIIAGADLSHVGGHFGDERELTPAFLQEVERHDRAVLALVEAGRPVDFLEHFAAEGNPTRVCSAGCIFVLLSALPDASAKVLCYHQAVLHEVQNCVTCAAVALTCTS